MCGRFARYQPLSVWLEPLDIAPDDDLFARDVPRYNIAPGTRTWVAVAGTGGYPVVDEYAWHFPTSRGNRINVRSETAHRAPDYQPHFDAQRCLVFASGFYEPEGPKSAKNRPWHFFRPRDESPLFFAGLMKADGFSILTGAPAAAVAPVHDRSPVMIAPDRLGDWLNPELSGRAALQQCVSTAAADTLAGWRVGDAAKRPANEGPALIQPPAQGELF